MLRTLEVYMTTNLQRGPTARELFVHTNTVDYRLKRISQLTGFDVSTVSGICRLRAALIIRKYGDRNHSGPFRAEGEFDSGVECK
ncbi:PucR family transcriptional regulator [Nocardia fluminea]